METLPNLPKRKVNMFIRHNTYKLEDFVDKSDDFIKSSNTGTILVSYNVLVNNFDLLKKIIKLLNIS